MPQTPRVSIIIPCRNEAAYIDSCIQSIRQGEQPEGGMEILAADGRSTDGTRDVLARLNREDPRIRMIDNPDLTVPYGLNAAIRAAQGDIIVRIDAHTEYAPDYVVRCAEALQQTDADVVGGPWVAKGKGYIGRTIAAAFQSSFSTGGGKAHDPDYTGYVDTVYLGCWHRQHLMDLGMFDEEFTRNQDDELNLRIMRRGGKVYQSTNIHSIYTHRNSLAKLFRQQYQYGFWKVRVIQKHRQPASIRHLVPIVFVIGIILGAALSLLNGYLAIAYAAFGGLYLLINLTASMLTARRDGLAILPLLPVVFFIFHFAYGWGFLRGMIHFVILRRGGKEAAHTTSTLTR
jgi:succinoglycan biosynthesis protein ExoA